MILPETDCSSVGPIFTHPDIFQFLQVITHSVVIGMSAHGISHFGDIQCALNLLFQTNLIP